MCVSPLVFDCTLLNDLVTKVAIQNTFHHRCRFVYNLRKLIVMNIAKNYCSLFFILHIASFNMKQILYL